MKLKERLLMGLVGFSLAVIMLLIAEFTDLMNSPSASQSEENSFHGFIRSKEQQFSRRNLQKTASHGDQSQNDYSAAAKKISGETGNEIDNQMQQQPTPSKTTAEPNIAVNDPFKSDSFNDVVEALDSVSKEQAKWKDLLNTYSKRRRRKYFSHRKRTTIAEIAEEPIAKNSTVYDRFQLGISDQDLYPENDRNIDKMLQKIATQKFSSITQKDGGTQFKLIVTLADGGEALFKPSRFPREQVKKATWLEKGVSQISTHFYDVPTSVNRVAYVYTVAPL